MADDYAVEYTDFSTGLDVTSAIEEIPMLSVRACKNVDFDTRGLIAARKRFALLKAVGEPVKAIFPFYSKGTGIYVLMVWAGTHLYKVSDSAVVQVCTVTSVDSAVTFWVDTVQKDCFIFNDGISLKKYDGTTVTDLTTTTKGKYLAIHKNRLCVTGDTTGGKEEVVFISKIGAPYDFSEGIAIRIPTWQGDVSIGLIEYMDKLYMLKYNSVQMIVGDVISNFAAYPAINNIGALCPRAIDTNGAYLMFIGSDKVAYLFGGTDIQDISSERVKPYFEAIDTTKLDAMTLRVFGAKAFVVLPQKNGSTVTMVYDMSRENWTVYDIGTVNAIGIFRRNNLNILTIGVGSSVYEQKDTVGVDDFYSADTPVMIDLRPIGADTAISIKKFRKMFLGISSANPVTVETYTDLYPTKVTVQFTPTKEEEVFRLGVKGRTLYVKITGASDLRLNRFSVVGRMKQPK